MWNGNPASTVTVYYILLEASILANYGFVYFITLIFHLDPSNLLDWVACTLAEEI